MDSKSVMHNVDSCWEGCINNNNNSSSLASLNVIWLWPPAS